MSYFINQDYNWVLLLETLFFLKPTWVFLNWASCSMCLLKTGWHTGWILGKPLKWRRCSNLVALLVVCFALDRQGSLSSAALVCSLNRLWQPINTDILQPLLSSYLYIIRGISRLISLFTPFTPTTFFSALAYNLALCGKYCSTGHENILAAWGMGLSGGLFGPYKHEEGKMN